MCTQYTRKFYIHNNQILYTQTQKYNKKIRNKMLMTLQKCFCQKTHELVHVHTVYKLTRNLLKILIKK